MGCGLNPSRWDPELFVFSVSILAGSIVIVHGPKLTSLSSLVWRPLSDCSACVRCRVARLSDLALPQSGVCDPISFPSVTVVVPNNVDDEDDDDDGNDGADHRGIDLGLAPAFVSSSDV